MELIVNGQESEHANGITLPDLVQRLGTQPDRVAVMINGDVISRAQWADHKL